MYNMRMFSVSTWLLSGFYKHCVVAAAEGIAVHLPPRERMVDVAPPHGCSSRCVGTTNYVITSAQPCRAT
jgi:hypothetical protein